MVEVLLSKKLKTRIKEDHKSRSQKDQCTKGGYCFTTPFSRRQHLVIVFAAAIHPTMCTLVTYRILHSKKLIKSLIIVLYYRRTAKHILKRFLWIFIIFSKFIASQCFWAICLYKVKLCIYQPKNKKTNRIFRVGTKLLRWGHSSNFCIFLLLMMTGGY